jgi:hypothetical protein
MAELEPPPNMWPGLLAGVAAVTFERVAEPAVEVTEMPLRLVARHRQRAFRTLRKILVRPPADFRNFYRMLP